MRDSLLTLDQVHQRLQATEPLSTDMVNGDRKITFKLDPGWETSLDTTEGTEAVGAVMRIDGTDHRMTKDAAIQAATQVGMSAAYVKKTPGALIENHLNYHYGAGLDGDEYKVLSVGENIAAFTRPNVVPFSNLQLLDNAVEGICARYGANAEILADYKFMNTLQQTDIRLIVPEQDRIIANSGMSDVPENATDLWSAGIHLTNSLIGKKQTAVEAYLFRWWCTNGCTTTMDEAGVWSRRVDGQEEDVYAWARDSVESVLGGLEHRFDQVQALTALDVRGNTADVLKDIYSQYEVPVSQRETIRAEMMDADTLTMYTIMQAITRSANLEGMDPRRADKLMRIGGDIPSAVFDTLKAKVWREGNSAQPASQNPYEIVSI
jgi:hypothetical protein